MGNCITKTIVTENPENVFEVIFADTEQTLYHNAHLEINSSDIILYRKSKPPLSWPLGSLRRYGYDANFFTFESGRRCCTGEGIFSFKCKRADVLFNTLQSYINGRAYNVDDPNIHDFAVPNASNRNIAQLNTLNMTGTLQTSIQGSSYIVNARPNSALSPAGTNSMRSSRDTLSADYLEPNPTRIPSHASRLSANMRLSSFGSGGPLSPSSPGSPNSYTNILEITNLNSHTTPQVTHGNIYQEYPSSTSNLQKPTKLSLDVAPAEPAPVANQVKTPKSETNVYMNAEIGIAVSEPEPKPARATLAKMESLDLEPEISSPDSLKAPPYMNVDIEQTSKMLSPTVNVEAVKENQPPTVTTPVLTNNLNSKINDKKDYTKNVTNGNIFGFYRTSSFTQEPVRCYENLEVGLSDMKPLMLRNRYSRPEIFSKVDLPLIDRTDKSEPCTPTQRKVNYIVLDLDQPTLINHNNLNNNNLNASGNNNEGEVQTQLVTSISMQNGLLPPESPSKKLGYATIDFNRSTALSNSFSNTPITDSDQSIRKTRHDSNALMTMKHSNSISE